jgi:hypothetical protein
MGQLMKPMLSRLAVVITLLAGIGSARAEFIAYDNYKDITDGIQNWQGNLGLDFTVNSSISVVSLGAFDNGNTANLIGSDLSSGVTVGIFDLGTSLLVGPSVLITPISIGSQINGDFFVSVTPFTLGPGNYSIVTFNDQNYNSGFTNGTQANLDDGGGLLDFHVPTALSRYDAGSSFDLPPSGGGYSSGVDNYVPVPRFDAGTFQFNAATPEPGSLVLLCTGLVSIGWLGWVRKRSKNALASCSSR